MHYNALVSLLLAASQLAVAAPSTQASTYKSLRLIKTSASDPGQWVESADFFEKFTSKGINFIDITDIEVCGPPSLPLSSPPGSPSHSSKGYLMEISYKTNTH